MDFEPFGAGILPGGLRDPYEIKILICYLLDAMGGVLTRDQMNAIFQESRFVNYFDYAEALSALLSSGHVTEEAENALRVTDLGKSTAHTLKRSLPRSVRDKVVRIAMGLLARMRREAENTVEIHEASDGVVLTVKIHDIGSDLLSLDLFLPDRMQAEMAAELFLQDPSTLYKGVIALLTGDRETVRDLMSSREGKDSVEQM